MNYYTFDRLASTENHKPRQAIFPCLAIVKIKIVGKGQWSATGSM